MLFQNFNTWKVKYVQQGANGVAHRLAQIALTSGMEQTWHDNFPLSMMDIVCADSCFKLIKFDISLKKKKKSDSLRGLCKLYQILFIVEYSRIVKFDIFYVLH
jgi:hypothetical protein